MTGANPPRTDSESKTRSLLLIRFRRIGDIVLTTPSITLLRQRFPDACLTYLVEEPYRRLVEGHPDIDRVLAVPAGQSRREFIGLIRAIRRERFDILLDFHGGPRAAWITLGSGALLKIGHAIQGKGFLYHKTAPRRGTDVPLHSVENHAGLIRAMGARFDRSDIPPLTLPPAAPEEAVHVDELLLKAGIRGGRPPLVVLHLGAGNAFRDWGADNEASLAAALLAAPGPVLALIGGETDRTRETEIAGHVSPERLLRLAGRLNLVEIRELISRAALFIGPDSGPMHIAASTSTPIIAYFGPTLPALFGPWRPGLDPARTVIFQKSLDCRPCRQRECVTGDYRCLRTIAPADILAAALSFLSF